MEAPDWSDAAERYVDDVASVYELDRKKQVRQLVRRYGGTGRSAVDLGCGPGKFLRLLSEHFGAVHACDYSEAMLANARGRTGASSGVTFERCDLRRHPPSCLPADFGLCVNVLIPEGIPDRESMWRNVVAAIRPGGRLALVVPSLESSLLARHRLVEWNLRSGTPPTKALTQGFDDSDPDARRIARGGIMDAGGLPTKHYLREEIETTAARFGLRVESCEKIEYRWNTEFADPPRWMRAPYPWDWLAVLGKR